MYIFLSFFLIFLLVILSDGLRVIDSIRIFFAKNIRNVQLVIRVFMKALFFTSSYAFFLYVLNKILILLLIIRIQLLVQFVNFEHDFFFSFFSLEFVYIFLIWGLDLISSFRIQKIRLVLVGFCVILVCLIYFIIYI